MKKLLALLIIICISTTNVGIVLAALDTNITHYYNYNANSNDSVGSNNGTDTNSPTYTTGKISNAITFASASSQYVTYTSATLFPVTTNTYTVNLWVNYTTTTGTQSICMGINGAGNLLFYLAGGVLTHSKSSVVDLNYTWTGITASTWYMLTFVGSSTGMATYLNGSVVASNSNSSNIADPGSAIPCGGYKNAGVMQAGWYMNGKQDEMGIWSRALTPAEISQLYNGGSGLAYPFSSATTPSTMGFFRLLRNR